MAVVRNLLGCICLGKSFLFKYNVMPVCTNIAKAFNTAEIVSSCNGCLKPRLSITIPATICSQSTV